MKSRIAYYAEGAFWMGAVAAATPFAMALGALPERLAVPIANRIEAVFNRWVIGIRRR